MDRGNIFARITSGIVGTIAAATVLASEVRGELLISEIMCDPGKSLPDWRGEYPDWIEIYNPDKEAVDLQGWYLTDDPDELDKWEFTAGSVRPRRYYVVFASGLDEDETGGARLPHASFKLSSDGEYVALVKPDGSTIAHAVDFRNKPQQYNLSYGLPPDETGFRIDAAGDPSYLSSPTPGRTNYSTLEGLVEAVTFDQPHGFYDAPISVTLSSKTPQVTIRYTTNGSEPTAKSGKVASGAISIMRTTTLRAAAFREGWKESPTVTQTYLFIDDIIRQSPNGEAPEGWPEGFANSQRLDYGMDPRIVDEIESPDAVKESLQSLPALSVVTSIGNLFDPRNGIYANPQQKGADWERRASFELIDPAGKEAGFQADAGLRIRGGFSRQPSNPKHALRLIFRKEYGAGKLNFPLFGDEGSGAFDFIDLRTSLNYSWAMGGSTRNTILRDVFSRDSQREMGQPYTRSRFYHLFLNGQYWGVYQTQERVTDSYGETYLDGKKEDFDVIKTRGDITAGNRNAQTRLFRAALRGFRDDKDYFAVQGMNPDGTRNEELERLVDIDNLIDYMVIIFYTGNKDGPGGTFTSFPNNYYSIYNRNNPDGFKYFAHDMEHSLDVGEYDMTRSPNGMLTRPQYLNPYALHMRFVESAQYRKRFKERAEKHLFGDGVFTDENALARLDKRAAEIDKAIIAHSARWGDANTGSPRTATHWRNAVERSRKWLRGRSQVVINQFVRRGWYDGILPPTFVRGKAQNLYLSSDEGTIYYTRDGTDPLDREGKLRDTALKAEQPKVDHIRLVSEIAPLRSHVPLDASVDRKWIMPGFDDSRWRAGVPGVGYDDDGDYLFAIKHDVTETLRGNTLSIYLRWTFDAPVTEFDNFLLGMKFDDGFAAYLNGKRITTANAPEVLNWKSRAPTKVADSMAMQWQVYPFPGTTPLKEEGNVLAIHGLNESLDSSDFLILPSLIGQKITGGTNVAEQQVRWSSIRARVVSPDGKWSPLGRYDPAAPIPGRELF